ncbi:MAG: DUF11 domain-containing protein [Thiolinea sp.]
MGLRSLVLTCCAVGVLSSAGQAWAVDNCAQITAQNEADVDSTPDTTGANTLATLLANNPTDTANDPDSEFDDEDCAALTVTILHDFGDAPDTYGTTTTSTLGPAQHEIVPWLKLGAAVDAETNGVPTTTADGDDLAGTPDDEDGVSIPALTAGKTAPKITLTAPVNNSGADAYAACWIDYDVNGTFDAGEFGSVVVPNGNTADLTITMPDVPATVPTADAIGAGIDSYARCRLSNVALTAANAAGIVNDTTDIADGEVEDYPVDFVAEAVFDLALTKALASGQATNVNVGDDVIFTLNVLNQGGVDATDIIITDYIPDGLILNDSAWTAGTNTEGLAIATLNTALDIAANGGELINITFTVASGAAGDLINTAEISDANGGKDVNGDSRVDVDSTSDTTNTDTVKDNVIDEDGKADSANDEDDHDIATIHVNQVDLDLGKRVLNKAGTAEITEAYRGDTVIYELTVTNSGPDTATGIVISDVLPAGVTYVSDNAVSPADYDNTTGEWTVGSGLAAGESATLQITVIIDGIVQTSQSAR